jgi:hypothetical protein
VVGSKAGGKWMSDDLMKRAEAVDQLGPFFKSKM